MLLPNWVDLTWPVLSIAIGLILLLIITLIVIYFLKKDKQKDLMKRSEEQINIPTSHKQDRK